MGTYAPIKTKDDTILNFKIFCELDDFLFNFKSLGIFLSPKMLNVFFVFNLFLANIPLNNP